MSVNVGAQVPRRGNAFSRWLGRTVLALMGWRLEGEIPNLPKMVMIGAPHTTNMDGVIAIATLSALGLRASTMIKDTAFAGPLGIILRFFGAIPVNRRSPKGIVEQSIDQFNSHPQFILLIAPEGTRHAAENWKRGFHLVASGAQAPVLAAAINYSAKIVTFGPPQTTTGDYEADLRSLLAFYARHAVARYPEKMSRPMAEALGQTWQPKPRPHAK